MQFTHTEPGMRKEIRAYVKKKFYADKLTVIEKTGGRKKKEKNKEEENDDGDWSWF